jgi:hypothetical protein
VVHLLTPAYPYCPLPAPTDPCLRLPTPCLLILNTGTSWNSGPPPLDTATVVPSSPPKPRYTLPRTHTRTLLHTHATPHRQENIQDEFPLRPKY